MTVQLREFVASPEDPSSVPSSYVWCLTTAYMSLQEIRHFILAFMTLAHS